MIDLLAAVFSIAFVQQALQVAIPYVLGALGAAVTERAGIVDLAVEAKLLLGAFAAAAVAHATGSIVLGAVAGAAAGATLGLLQALCSTQLRADQVIVGIAFNLIALSGTRYLLQVVYGQGANSSVFDGMGDALLANPVFWGAAAAALAVPWGLVRTRFGLRTRAAGDRPDALRAAGVSVARTRLAATALGGALAGLGGAQLSLAVGVFTADMSAGRGYIALVATILASWRPRLAALVCLGFAAGEALNYRLQVLDTGIPRELGPMIPYLLALAVLAGFGGGRRPPAALGQPDA